MRPEESIGALRKCSDDAAAPLGRDGSASGERTEGCRLCSRWDTRAGIAIGRIGIVTTVLPFALHKGRDVRYPA